MSESHYNNPKLPAPFKLRGDELAVAIFEDWTQYQPLTEEKGILFSDDPTFVRFIHRCDRSHRNAGVIVCAPQLQIGNGHEIVTRDPLTIRASILCTDCQTHGFVTEGHWIE